VDATPEPLEDTSETLSSRGEKMAPVIFALFVAGMGYLVYRDVMLAVRGMGLISLLTGLLVMLYAARSIARARASTSWPVVEAMVTRSDVFTRKSTSTGRNQAVSATMYEHYPAVWYEYEVQGQRYRSKRIIFFRTNYTRSDAEVAVARYPIGRPVTAHFNPANPKVAVLEPGLGANAGHYHKGYAAAAFFAGIGLLIAFGVPWAIDHFR
jgi:hypothetical protein